jgi:hypothetical protein
VFTDLQRAALRGGISEMDSTIAPKALEAIAENNGDRPGNAAGKKVRY